MKIWLFVFQSRLETDIVLPIVDTRIFLLWGGAIHQLSVKTVGENQKSHDEPFLEKKNP